MSERDREDDDAEEGASPSSPLNRPLHTEELPADIECPFCHSRNTEQFSAFGSSLSVSQYYCNGCRTVFEAFKWRDRSEEDSAGEE